MARPRGIAETSPRVTAARKQAAAAAAGGITPLDVMLRAMRAHVDAGNLDAAAGIAKDAAPYVHARLAAMQVSGLEGGPIPLSLMVTFRNPGEIK